MGKVIKNVEDTVIRMRGISAILQSMSDAETVVEDTDLALGLLAEELNKCARVVSEEFNNVVNGSL